MKCVMDEVVDEFIVQEQLTLGGDLFGSLGKHPQIDSTDRRVCVIFPTQTPTRLQSDHQ